MTTWTSNTGVVAIGRNEGERLVRCLESLRDSECPVVYVDSASTDGSLERARALGAEVVALDMTRPFTAARARAEGLAALRRLHPTLQTVFFVDGDCEVEPGFLPAAHAFLQENPRFAVVCGRRRERFPDASSYNALIDREWATPVGEASACGGDALYRLAAYDETGGFDPAMLAGEEPELCFRLRSRGWRIMRIDQPMTIHDAAMTRFAQWWRRAVRGGMGVAQAWVATGSNSQALYAREIARAVFWAGALPLLALALAIAFHPLLLLVWPVVTALQFARLGFRSGPASAMLATVGKFAELLGILRYLGRRLSGKTGSTLNYK